MEYYTYNNGPRQADASLQARSCDDCCGAARGDCHAHPARDCCRTALDNSRVQRGRFTQPLLDSDISSASEQLGQGSADFLYECGRQASGVGHLGGRALGNARARLTNRSRSSQISFPGNHYGSGGAAQLGQIAGFGDRLAAAKHCSYTEMPLLDL